MSKLCAICRTLAVALIVTLATSASAQFVGQSARKPAPDKPSVEYLFPEQIKVPSAKPATVELHFRVGEGLHVNSHTPRSPELIPTALTIPADSGVQLQGAVYPKGSDFAFAIDSAYKLSVYTGEFVVKARIVAAKGRHLVEARLRYQACDNNACLPPRTITAALEVVGE